MSWFAVPMTAHMLAHMAIVAVVAPAIALLLAGGRADPVRRAPHWFSAIPASILEFVVVWGWHAPALHLAARHHPAIFVLEQGSMLLVSLWLWLAILGGPTASRPGRAAAGLIALVLTFSHMTMLGAVLTLSPRDLYGHGADGLADQQRAGAVMIAAATVTYLGAAVWLSRLLLSRAAAERRA